MSGDLSTCPRDVDLLIVGAGLSGAVLAERCSRELGMTSLVIDKRDHLGGNCYDYVTADGIRCSKYGAHLFHTQHERVWRYVQEFSQWLPFDHRVKGRVVADDGTTKLVPIPPTQETVNALFEDTDVRGEAEMQAWYDTERVAPPNGRSASNGEEAALSRVGPRLYEKIFRHYTKKQWDKYPEELDASVLMRLPCRTSTDDRYFPDQYQALPARGYTRIFENMLLGDPNVTIRLNCDFFRHRTDGTLPKHGLLVYTGQIDSYYAALGMPKLEYRSLRFEEEYVPSPPRGFLPGVDGGQLPRRRRPVHQNRRVQAHAQPTAGDARRESSRDGDRQGVLDGLGGALLPRAQPGEPGVVREVRDARGEGARGLFRRATGELQVLQHGPGDSQRAGDVR